jgi:UDP-N-acetylglucosamine:LPS N-acetylglucosamine transferase
VIVVLLVGALVVGHFVLAVFLIILVVGAIIQDFEAGIALDFAEDVANGVAVVFDVSGRCLLENDVHRFALLFEGFDGASITGLTRLRVAE